MKKTSLLLVAAASIVLGGCSAPQTQKLAGAGATFPEPYYKMAFKQYATNSGDAVTYGAIGSGGGIRSLKDMTVDFGATDVFLSEKELEGMPASIVHMPTCLGAVVLSFNVPGVKELRLTADLVAGIYLGTVTRWDDQLIAAVNPGVDLPNLAITAVFRSDGSGSTAVFSEYMSKVNGEWKEKIGKGKALKFPVGVSAKGNAGVAGLIAETAGAVGYIGSEYALALNLPTAALQNSSGAFVKASPESISASANVDMPDDTRTVITNSSNPEAYPISTFTWLIVYAEQNYNGRTEGQAKALVRLLNFMLTPEAQTMATQTNYAPLPAKALEKAQKAVESIQYKGKRVALAR